jgi:hypothetical protein
VSALRSLGRRLLFADQPQETRFFLFLAAWGLGVGLVYWFLTYETAGSALLIGFGIASAAGAAWLMRSRPAVLAARAERREPGPDVVIPEVDTAGGGTVDIDRPFLDERGRVPEDTLAPLALGLGISLAATAIVFGPWLIVAAAVPLVWGAWAWLTGARDELDATQAASDAAARGRTPAAGSGGEDGHAEPPARD